MKISSTRRIDCCPVARSLAGGCGVSTSHVDWAVRLINKSTSLVSRLGPTSQTTEKRHHHLIVRFWYHLNEKPTRSQIRR